MEPKNINFAEWVDPKENCLHNVCITSSKRTQYCYFQDIKQILDNAKQGFIYFSMGSTWQSKDIPTEVTRGLLEMFGNLKVTVIWKYEEDLKNVPKNVHILKWAPQTSILGKFFFFSVETEVLYAKLVIVCSG